MAFSSHLALITLYIFIRFVFSYVFILTSIPVLVECIYHDSKVTVCSVYKNLHDVEYYYYWVLQKKVRKNVYICHLFNDTK